MKILKNLLTIIVLIGVLLFFTGCSDNKEEELKQKVISELEYLNLKIIDMLNELNNISFDNYKVISEKVSLDDETQTNQAQKEEGSTEEGEQGSSEGNTKEESQGGNSGEKQNQGNSQGGGGGSSGQGGKTQETENQDLINTTKMVTDSMLQNDRNNIDWNKIKPEIELVNEAWGVILLDLYTLNVEDNTILDFSSKLDSCIIAIKNEDKNQSLVGLADMYASIPEFLKQIKADTNLQKIRRTQSYVINAYVLAQDMTNIGINDNIKSAIDEYSEIMSDIDYIKDKTQKTNKIYVLLNELSNSIEEQDSDLFYLKYKNFMKAINEL